MFGIGGHELLLILLVALVVFGARRLPEIGSGLGRAIKNFKKATTEPEEIDISQKKSETPVNATATTAAANSAASTTVASTTAESSAATTEKTNG